MKKKTRTILSAVLLIIAVVCIAYIVYYYVKQSENSKVYEKAQKQVDLKQEQKQENESAPKETKKPEEAKKPEKAKEKNPINFKSLQEMNPDIYAWINIQGTNINYPIAQSATDNAYYLDNTVDGKAGLPGSIYTENYNAKDFSDFNTLIYGHDMRDGSMFQNLHKYADPTFFKEHPKVYIYTPDRKLTYEIFEAVVYDDRHILKSFDFSKKEQRQEYLDSLKSIRDLSSIYDDNVEVNTNSKIITMSTCIGDKPNNRYLVGAVLTDEYKY